MDHCVHYAAIVQYHLDAAGHAELYRCAVRAHAGDADNEHCETDEDCFHLDQVPVPLGQPVDKDDLGDGNGGQDQLVRGGHRRIVCPGLSISSTGARHPFECAYVGHQARRRIPPHLPGI